jgi:hypothetical protein
LHFVQAPDPATVRPLPVLKKALQLIYNKWKENASYAYLCDQLKSVRQDLTVQRIKNEFTVAVYQAHARLALMHVSRCVGYPAGLNSQLMISGVRFNVIG